MTSPVRPKVRKDLVVVEIDGEAVVYDEKTGNLHHLNPTATVIFSVFDGTATMRELSSEVSQAFGVSANEVEGQIRALQRHFRRQGLLENGTKRRG